MTTTRPTPAQRKALTAATAGRRDIYSSDCTAATARVLVRRGWVVAVVWKSTPCTYPTTGRRVGEFNGRTACPTFEDYRLRITDAGRAAIETERP